MGRFLYITGDGALQSSVLDHTYSEDQFFKLFVRDQNPNVIERMDQHVSVVTVAEDGDGNRDWEKPVTEPTGGYGRYSFITHFDMLINQHGYFTKHDNVVLQVISEDMRRDEPFDSKLDSCEPCFGELPGERVCKWNDAAQKAECACSDPMVEIKGKCVCPSGYIFNPQATLRARCIDVCSMSEPSFCRENEQCVHTDNGVACIDSTTEDAEANDGSSFSLVNGPVMLLLLLKSV